MCSLQQLAVLALAALVLGPGCTETGVPIGSQCLVSLECQADLQCLNRVCVPRCLSDVQCGEGFLCREGGECEVVVSAPGDPCHREHDCGPGLACLPELTGQDNEGGEVAFGRCSYENIGGTMGNDCEGPNDCRNGICVAGLCSQLCVSNRDCPMPFECALILVSPTSRFRGCYPYEEP